MTQERTSRSEEDGSFKSNRKVDFEKNYGVRFLIEGKRTMYLHCSRYVDTC